ncbi:DUF916 domain-containing protein [Microbacterium album]|uniref:DUF916 domain-containing protein n=1 Tax=Microbacterium album TaxID=2053191 RepID=A0A917IJJ9_9MICO|nr:DUF916 domain-containing protein [Microbacterium album]GGH49845.1 hypothetical protein GCM10010921_28210 [Microbacterium album]
MTSRTFPPRRHRGVLPRLLAAAALAGAVLAPAPVALAADEEPGGDVVWGVQPSTPDGPDGRTAFEYQVAPGSVITDWVAVTNRGTAPATFRVYAADATADYDSGAFALVGADVPSTGAGAWTSVDGAPSACEDEADVVCALGLGASITLEPGARADLPFTITVPHDATPGDHTAGVVAGYLSETGGEGATVRREDRVGARIYLRVDGPLTPGLGVSGTVADYAASWIPFFPGSAHAGFEVVNAGNTRVSVTPSVRLTGPFGIDLGTVALDPIENLVPGATTHVSAELPGIPPLLLLTADVTLTATPASGVAASDPLPAPVTASVVAWAVPWTGLAVLAVIAGAVWLVIWRRRRTRAQLAEELAEYAERVRAENAAPLEPAPAGAGYVPRAGQETP